MFPSYDYHGIFHLIIMLLMITIVSPNEESLLFPCRFDWAHLEVWRILM